MPHPQPPAPWRPLFESHLSQTPNKEFTLATTSPSKPGQQSTPHVRTVGFRGFFPSPPLNPKAIEALQNANVGLNPEVWESDMLVCTSDVRMGKVGDITVSSGENGGPVEAVFWIRESSTQWRVSGRAFVFGNPAGGEVERGVKEGLKRGMRRVDHSPDDDAGKKEGEEDWSWERQVTIYFANHTPVLRGSFKSPPPGIPKSAVPDPNSGLGLGQKVTDLFDPVARANFRVVVVRPECVERLDLADYENPERVRWVLVDDGQGQSGQGEGGGGARWVETELWP